jgi:FixJ family two-component response regulator
MLYTSASPRGPDPICNPVAVVHLVVSTDEDSLGDWLTAAGLELRTYDCLRAFLEAMPGERPGCLIIGADHIASTPMVCPSIAIAHRADVKTVVRAMRNGAIDVVERPLCEHTIMPAIYAAIDADRRHRLAAASAADLNARFAKLSPRERQVMSLVTAGLLNKQVGGELGLSEITVKAHRGSVMRKMCARTLADLVRMADALGEALASR